MARRRRPGKAKPPPGNVSERKLLLRTGFAFLQGLFQLPNQLATKIAQPRFIIGDPRQRAAQLHRLDPQTGGQQTGANALRGARRQPGRQILRHPVHSHLTHQFAGAGESDIEQHQRNSRRRL